MNHSSPIVLLITVCTLRRDHLGCYGYQRNTSPFIDHLAAQGRRYDFAFTPVPVTQPAHTAIFTARYSGWNGVGVYNATRVPPAQTWVTELNNAGVNTAGLVSSVVLGQNQTQQFNLTYYDDDTAKTEISRDNLTRRAETTVDACLKWFENSPSHQPRFCFIHLADTHAPYDVPNPIASQFVQKRYSGHALPLGELYAPGVIAQIASLAHLSNFPGAHYGSYYIDRYDGCLAYIDQQVRRLVYTLSERETNLMVILAGDHGEAFGEDDYWCIHSHGVLQNQTLVPFIIWSSQPDRLAEVIDSSAPISLLDIGPTVMDLFGLAPKYRNRQHGWSLFDHTRDWETRRIFALSLSQILAYNQTHQDGVVLGEQTQASSFRHTINVEKHRSYFDLYAPVLEEQITEALLFYELATRIGTKWKPVSVTWFENKEERLITQRLADLGYVDHIPDDLSSSNIDEHIMSIPSLRGVVDWHVSRANVEQWATELQVSPALDLGCGALKSPGFIGVDRFALPGVDLVNNFDAPLPFSSDSFDLVFASHSLEHAKDLMATMQEIYRICRHGAQVCIVAPYSAQAINAANPYHTQSFNEHTPRFWTTSNDTSVALQDYWHPHAGLWGLGASDNSKLEMDLRCLRMEFFYFPEYRYLSPEEQRAARKKYVDVCDQIVYHLLVVKEPTSEAEMQDLAQRIEYYDPPYVKIRRLEERLAQVEIQTAITLTARNAELEQAQTTLASRASELAQTQSALTARNAELEQAQTTLASRTSELVQAQTELTTLANELAQARTTLATRTSELAEAKIALAAHDAELAQVHNSLTARDSELAKTRQLLDSRDGQLQQQRAAILTRDAELQQARQVIQVRESVLEQLHVKGIATARELDASRRRRLTRTLEQLTHRSNAWDNVGLPFQQLKDDMLLFHAEHDLDGYLLQPSINLQHVPFVYYPLTIGRANLAGILLAAILDFPATAGTLGIEIVSPQNTLVAQTTIPLNQVSDVVPARLKFPTIRETEQGQFWLRVFVRDADVPVRVFEWRKYTWLGLGKIKTHAFCGFEFQS